MKLSTAMMLGSTVKHMHPETWDTCLLGVSVAALGCARNSLNKEAIERWPWIKQLFTTPDLYRSLRQEHLRTAHIEATAEHIISEMAAWVYAQEMTLEQAVDWVKSVEPQESVTSSADIHEGEGARMSLEGALIDAEQYRADSLYSVSEHAFEHSEHLYGTENVRG